MLDFIMCASTNFFRIFLIDRFAAVFLGQDEEKKNRRILVCVSFFIINTALFWEFHTVWINVICNLIGISAIVRLYTKSVKTNIFVTSSIYMINCACDAAVFLAVDYREGEINSQIYAVILFFLILICELLAEKIITIHKNVETTQNFPLMLVPICSIAVILLLSYSGVCASRGIAIVSIGLLVINFLMLYLYNLLLHSISQKYETEMLQQKI